MHIPDCGVTLVYEVFCSKLLTPPNRFRDLLRGPPPLRQLTFPFGRWLEGAESPRLRKALASPCGMGGNRREFRPTALIFWVQSWACISVEPGVQWRRGVKIPDACFRVGVRVRRRDARSAHQSRDAREHHHACARAEAEQAGDDGDETEHVFEFSRLLGATKGGMLLGLDVAFRHALAHARSPAFAVSQPT